MLVRAKDFLSIDQLSREELARLLQVAAELKSNRDAGRDLLSRRKVGLMFQKPSLRTRVSFEVAAQELGAYCLYLSPSEVGLGERESARDVARVLSRYIDAVVARTFLHRDVELLAEAASIPVINGLSERSHPCQILADLQTMQERFGQLDGLRVAYVGDGNNVTRSLIEAAPLVGLQMRIATPEGYAPDSDAVEAARRLDAEVELFQHAEDAVRDADVIYTDAWFSMGQEAEREARAAVFPPFQVSSRLLAHAPDHALVMHCLPAHRGEEITDEVIDGPQSVVFDQAENRLHAQKALLVELLAGQV